MTADLADTLVSDVLAANPAAVRVFNRYGMACAGCPFARFETVAEAARAYDIEPGALAAALARACRRRPPTPRDHNAEATSTSR